MKVDFSVLAYVNRSGSTLLSRLLSESSNELFVMPELYFPVALITAHSAGRNMGGKEMLGLIKADLGHRALRLEDRQLARICDNNDVSDLRKLFTDIAVAKTGRTPARILLKLTNLIYIADEIEAALGPVSWLHIVRDPRGAASSMMTSEIPGRPGYYMDRGTPVFSALYWRSYMRSVVSLAKRFPFKEVRYEDLLLDERIVISELLDFLRVRPKGSPRTVPDTEQPLSSAEYQIAQEYEPLHLNLFGELLPDRASAWKRQLSLPQVRIIESIAGDEMLERGYAMTQAPLSTGSFEYRRAFLDFRVRMGKYYVGTLMHYLSRSGGGKALLWRLRRALMEKDISLTADVRR